VGRRGGVIRSFPEISTNGLYIRELLNRTSQEEMPAERNGVRLTSAYLAREAKKINNTTCLSWEHK
jgi:hypothetical protein